MAKTKLETLIEKYSNELKIRKHNMSEMGESLNDTERHHEELAIRKNAEIVRDLKSLQNKK